MTNLILITEVNNDWDKWCVIKWFLYIKIFQNQKQV